LWFIPGRTKLSAKLLFPMSSAINVNGDHVRNFQLQNSINDTKYSSPPTFSSLTITCNKMHNKYENVLKQGHILYSHAWLAVRNITDYSKNEMVNSTFNIHCEGKSKSL
jgi:hypothetical protein